MRRIMPLRAQDQIRAILTPSERSVFRTLSSAQRIQDYLDTLPINFELAGETNRSPRRVLRDRIAHCFEGAVLAAAAFAYHGRPPLLLDFEALPTDESHVVALFRRDGLWGAVSKTNHAVLRYRDPVYRSIRELAMSYFHEFYEWSGAKSLRYYSQAFDLSRYAPEKWIVAEDDLDWLVDDLTRCRHLRVAPATFNRHLRPVAPIELRTLRIVEWNKRGRRCV
jgi:hypothetical protein